MVFIFFLLPIIYCYNYKELPKYGSIEVYPYTRVYLNISSFETDEHISFEITMNFGYSSYYERNEYSFQIEQVSVSSYSDYYDWDNLKGVTSTNVDNNGFDDYTFKWEEIKQEGKTYIFILTPEPFYNFDYKIKIENIQENSSDNSDSNTVVDIIIGVIAIIIGVVIFIYCCKKRRNNYNQNIQNPVPQIPQPTPQMYSNYQNNLPYTNYNSPINPNIQAPFNYSNMNNNPTNIVINQTNTTTRNNYQINVQPRNNNMPQNRQMNNNRQRNSQNQNSSQQNPRQQDRRQLNYPQKNVIEQFNKHQDCLQEDNKSKDYPQEDNKAQDYPQEDNKSQDYPQEEDIKQYNKPHHFNKLQQINKEQLNPGLDNIQEDYPEKMNIQNNDPPKKISKPIEEDNSVHFTNSISYCPNNNIDSKSKIINNDNDNAAPTFTNNPH